MDEISAYYRDILNIFDRDIPLDSLSTCNILITGATGLIGGCLVETLMMNPHIDYHVYASGRNITGLHRRFNCLKNNPFLHFLTYDVLKPFDCNISFDYIIHAASNADPASFANNPVEVMKANIFGVSNLIDYGMQNGMKRFLFLSSGEVYGEGDGREFTESYSGFINPTSPRSCYPSSKRASETLCVSYKAEYNANVVIARPCHIYGPYFNESDTRVYAQFIRNIINNEDIVMKSSGEQYRSWCYVVDCVSALLFILLKGESGEAYNIANPESVVTIKELASIFAKLSSKEVSFSHPTFREAASYNPITKSIFSTEKVESLGWEPKTPLTIGIDHTLKELLFGNGKF